VECDGKIVGPQKIINFVLVTEFFCKGSFELDHY
jgi:hypothetical protein